MADDIAPAFALLSHCVSSVLTHADSVSVAFCGDYHRVAVGMYIKACRPETECSAYIVSRNISAADIG